jgi:hypothetical protein
MLAKLLSQSSYVAALLTVFALSAAASTPTERVLYGFQGGNDGAFPGEFPLADHELATLVCFGRCG